MKHGRRSPLSGLQIRRAVGLRDFGYKFPAIAAEYGMSVEALREQVQAYRKLEYKRRQKLGAKAEQRERRRRRKAVRESAIMKALARGLSVNEAAKVFGAAESTVRKLRAQM